MRKTGIALMMLLAGAALSAQPQHGGGAAHQTPPRPRFVFNATNPTVHDPVMAKDGDTYYIFSTGVSVMSSKDLVHWKPEEAPAVDFEWIQKYVPRHRRGAWAPDVIYHQGKWHMFCSPSAFGINTSVICHLTRSTLDPSVDEPWKDCGEIVHTTTADNYNAIDANVVVDEKGVPWMDFGSFWDGIQLVKLKKDMSAADGKPRTIARRYGEKRDDLVNPTSNHAGTNAIEAPFIYKHGGYYYLFVSWDYCCRGNLSSYKVAVGRSKNVEGPYLDKDGKDMAMGGGTVVAFNNDVYNASGHNSAYTIDGKDYYVSHAYERASGQSRLVLREIQWDEDQWPVIDLTNAKVNDAKKDVLTVNVNEHGADVNPNMYGIFYEEINHSGTGSLYAELLQNRDFEEQEMIPGCTYKDGYAIAPHRINYATGGYSDWKFPWNPDSLKFVGWKVEGKAAYDVVGDAPLNDNTPNSMKLVMSGKGTRLINTGYWGVRVDAGENYKLRFYTKADNYKGNITARIVSATGQVLASKTFKAVRDGQWNEYKAVLTSVGTDTKATFELLFDKKGTVHVDYVSLFPEKTFKGRENGLRADVAQALADLHPGFVRWPGGCIVEGATQKNGFKWKNTIGDPVDRKGEWILWGYRTTWGFGYHEFLQFCEDVGADPMYVTNVSLSCTVRNGDYVMDRDSLQYFIDDISDAIEYANGDVTTEWGAKRAAAGHPEPFSLKYVEVGNEQISNVYADIYQRIYAALKEKYPDIIFINTLGYDRQEALTKSGRIDMIDPHFYRSPEYFHAASDYFDHKERGRYQVYVGEYAALMGVGTGNMKAALSEAAWLTGLERNSDLVKMASYAPLIENTNRRDWTVNLIWTNNGGTVGRSSYYVQKMFSDNTPTYNVGSDLSLVSKGNPNKGYVGFAGVNLKSRVRDLKVSEGGKVVYTDDLAGLSNEGLSRDRFFFSLVPQIVTPKAYENATVEFKACPWVKGAKTTVDPDERQLMAEGRLSLVFGSDKNGANCQKLNFNNAGTVTLTSVVNGLDCDRPVEVPFEFEEGRWYDFHVVFEESGTASIYIDGSKVTETTIHPYETFHAIAGYDEKTGETVIKVVNGDKSFRKLEIALNCDSVEPVGKVITLKSEKDTDENSFEEPRKIAPAETEYKSFSKDFDYVFEPYSFTILRIKTK